MRFVKQVRLFFREGTSDKTYEIDLCEAGPGQYFVNFRYGKRGSALKEGSKTVSPVDLVTATAIYDALEKEKRSKGYAHEQDAVPVTEFVPPDISQVENPVHIAILKRLEYALKRNSKFKTTWKTSRVIWMAGELRIREAVPYITKLIEREDAMQRYAAIWALGRCGSPTEIPLLNSYAGNSTYPYFLRQIATHAMVLLLSDEERQTYVIHYQKVLPVEFQQAIAAGEKQPLATLLHERVKLLTAPSYPLLEDLYIVSTRHQLVREVLLQFLADLPLKSNYFQHIRHLFKQAELRDDHELVALLSIRFEREREMSGEPEGRSKRTAYSKRTRFYLRKRVLRNMKETGKRNDIQYVRFATALLLHYDARKENAIPYKTSKWNYERTTREWTSVDTHYPANARSVFLHYILSGNSKQLKLIAGDTLWQIQKEKVETAPPVEPAKEGGLFKKVAGLFAGKPKEIPANNNTVQPTPLPESEVPFFHLWQQLPQAFILLLVRARMDEVHAFALKHLQEHADYPSLKEKMDENVIRALLSNPFTIPQDYGLALAREKFDINAPSLGIIYALLNSSPEVARKQGMDWTVSCADICFADIDFIKTLIFCPYKDVRAFAKEQLATIMLSAEKARLLCGKAIAHMLTLPTIDSSSNDCLTDGSRILEQYYAAALIDLDFQIIEDLLESQLPAAHAFAARLLLLKKQQFNLDDLSDNLLIRLLDSAYPPVREAGMAVIAAISQEELAKREGLLMYACIGVHTDVRNGIRPVLKQLTVHYPALAVLLVNELVPLLMRKETSEGLHADLATILTIELVEHLQDIDQATALRLLYSNYRPAQEFGVVVLEKYIPAASLTIKQVIAAGNHELQVVRAWCWRFFEQHVARIRYERDDAVGLLDATWDDTRAFAASFFRTQFQAADWSAESLIAIADSVNPVVQALGRELLLHFFREEDGAVYLLKLSQHPGVAMQIFATGYLENYAADNLVYLRDLEHYFRSVLSRVNKARVAKERIFNFLEKEALKSREAATYIGDIIADISATVSIGDKARCISIMRSIHLLHKDLLLPVQFIEIPLKQS